MTCSWGWSMGCLLNSNFVNVMKHISIFKSVEYNYTILIVTAELNHSKVWNGSLHTFTIVPRKPLTLGMFATIWLWQGITTKNPHQPPASLYYFSILEWKYIASHIKDISVQLNQEWNQTMQMRHIVNGIIHVLPSAAWVEELITCTTMHINILNRNMMVAICLLCRIVCEFLINFQKHD